MAARKREVAKHMAHLHYDLIDLGDSFSQDVEMLCEDANVVYDEESREYEEDELYLHKKCEEAYEVLLDDEGYVQSFVDTLEEYTYIHILGLNYEDCNDILEHPILRDILSFAGYVAALPEEFFVTRSKEETKKILNEIIWEFLVLDMEVIRMGYLVSDEYWKYLNPEYYFISNTADKVGLVPDREMEERKHGDYAAHVTLSRSGDYGYIDCGYAIIYGKNYSGQVVGRIFEYKYKNHTTDRVLRSLDMEIPVTEDITGSAKKIAEAINALTIKDYGRKE